MWLGYIPCTKFAASSINGDRRVERCDRLSHFRYPVLDRFRLLKTFPSSMLVKIRARNEFGTMPQKPNDRSN